MSPLVVAHTERVDNPTRCTVGLLGYCPAVTVHIVAAHPGESRRAPRARTWFGVGRATSQAASRLS